MASRSPLSVVSWLLAYAAFLAVAQADPASAPHFTPISIDQGLSQNTVTAILQDSTGFLWFGTEEGLNRYDGYSITVFSHRPNDPHTPSSSRIAALCEDDKHQLWVGTSGGLECYDRVTESFTHVSEINSAVSALLADPDGTLWVGTDGHSIWKRRPGEAAFIQMPIDPAGSHGLSDRYVSCILRDHRGRHWIGLRNGGVDRIDATGEITHFRQRSGGLSSDTVWGLAEDRSGQLWVATYGGGLNVLDEETGATRTYRHIEGSAGALPTDLLTDVFVDRSDNIWVGTDGGGLVRLRSDGFVAYTHQATDPNSLSQNTIRTIAQDRQGQIWVGTFLGGADLLKFPRPGFQYFTDSPSDQSGLSGRSVASFVEDRDGQIWIGTEEGWLNRFDPRTGAFHGIQAPPLENRVAALTALEVDDDGRIWIGTFRQGLLCYDRATGAFTRYTRDATNAGGLSSDEIWALRRGKNGQLWVGTSEGLDRFDLKRRTVVAHLHPEQVGNGVWFLQVDRAGNLWAGCFGGLAEIPQQTEPMICYDHRAIDPGSTTSSGVLTVHEDQAGALWLGMNGTGLRRFDPSRNRFVPYHGLPSEVIYRIESDRAGNFWLSTNHGLARFSPATGTVSTIDYSNGLQSRQFHAGASLCTRSGLILFGSVDGFCAFNPIALAPDSFAPPVVLTSLRIFNEPVQLAQSLQSLPVVTLSHQDQVVSFGFAALDFSFPRQNRYSYHLEGFNDRWVNMGDAREVTFTNLNPGAYTLNVRASNRDGVWSPASAVAIKIVVLPPFWRTWWFRLITGILIAALLLTAHLLRLRFRLRKIRRHAADMQRHNEELEHKVLERTSELRRSYETLQETQGKLIEATRQAAQSELAVKQADADRWHLRAAVKEAELRALRSQVNPHFMFNSLTNLRALIGQDGEKAKLIVTKLSHILRYALKAGEQKAVELRLEIAAVQDYLDIQRIRFEHRLKAELQIDPETLSLRVPPLLLQTLVENAVKYGIDSQPKGGFIRIESKRTAAELRLRVVNSGALQTGKGISTGLGLKNAIERLQLIFGTSARLRLAEEDNTVVAEVIIPIGGEALAEPEPAAPEAQHSLPLTEADGRPTT